LTKIVRFHLHLWIQINILKKPRNQI